MINITKFEEVTSTNDVATDMGKAGAPHFTCIAASKQTAGRGRRGKIWTTLPNKSVACSIILRKNTSHLLPFVASLAVHNVLSRYVECAIKWPNDVLVNGKKISGILAEKIGSDENSFYVLGIGINVKSFDDEALSVIGTSIENEISKNVSVDEVLQSLVSSLSEYLSKNTTEILKEYRQNCDTIGKVITWVSDNEKLVGTAKKVTNEGSLILDVEGVNHEIMSGDIVAQGSKSI